MSTRWSALALVLLLAGCTASPSSGPVGIALPPTAGGFDYQLGGAHPAEVAVVVRDAGADPLRGAYSICYVNGFQTQPEDAALWAAHPELRLTDGTGAAVVDPDWPDEIVLDPSSPAQREGILEILGPVLRGCADAGFDAVEIDNLDTWTRFPAIEPAGARALAAEYVDLAHDAGLAIGQKNAAELTEVAHGALGFDFAITEECGAYDECAAFTDVYGQHVLQIEYPDSLAAAGRSFAQVCALPDRAPLTILRDRALVAEGEPGFVRRVC
ncbi:endo alpha-1,4 polygalactosaminidase [Brachybacterium sp. UNK5269]|uniref:endo alpha-1,4 polygalactosaminidase n=1 Tax=Brachybacterium sp. UNK5269 TaxID=3408576 RepID=UPI003BB15ACC